MLVLAGSPSAGAGANIGVSAAAAAAGGLRHAREGRVDRRVVGRLAPPAVDGAMDGGRDGHLLHVRMVRGGVSAVQRLLLKCIANDADVHQIGTMTEGSSWRKIAWNASRI